MRLPGNDQSFPRAKTHISKKDDIFPAQITRLTKKPPGFPGGVFIFVL